MHEYPGGAREVDDLGAFPLPLSWSGLFTGQDAFSRAQEVDRMRATAQVVTLSYGPQAFSGKIARFEYNPSHQWLIPYTIHFEPIEDLSGISTVPQGPPSVEAELSDETMATQDIQAGDDGLALPTSLSVPSDALLAAVQAGLNNGNGTVAGMQAADVTAIQVAAAAVRAASVPLIAGADPTQASPALDLSARAAAISIAVGSAAAIVTQFWTVNPNLFAIAAQYFGDATRWQDIATASGLADPQPVGKFLIQVPAA